MRTSKINAITITYPEEIVFCFNRNVITITNVTDVITIKIEGNGKEFTDTAEPFEGIAQKDISYYLQLLFEPLLDAAETGMSNISSQVSITLSSPSLTGGWGETFTCIWGSLSPFDKFPQSYKQMTLPKNYESVISVFYEGQEIWRSVDGGVPEKIFSGSVSLQSGIYNFIPDLSDAIREVKYMFGGTAQEVKNVFDTTFDYTFRKSAGMEADVTVKILIDDCKDGIFLRWIDRQGHYNFFLLSQKNVSLKTENNGDKVSMEHSNFYNIMRQNKNENTTINAYAHLANQYDFDNLTSLFTSPVAWLFVSDGQWIPVIVEPQDNVNAGDSLQDINMKISLPKSQIQYF